MSVEQRCIYCEDLYDPSKGNGDHIIPESLGPIPGSLVFRGLCLKCNNEIGKLEQELLQITPEAARRRFAGLARSRRNKRVGPKPAGGLPPPKFIRLDTEYEKLVDLDPDKPSRVVPVDQLVLELKDGRSIPVRIPASISLIGLKSLIERHARTEDIREIKFSASVNDADRIQAMIQDIWPLSKLLESNTVEPYAAQIPISVECHYGSGSWRALAKIAFHYFLSQSKYGYGGNEKIFDPIRRFIRRDEGDRSEFFLEKGPDFVAPIGWEADGGILVPENWMSFICCIETGQSAIVGVYLLLGPEAPPQPHYVQIFAQRHSLFTREYAYGHQYVYVGDTDNGERKSRVEPVQWIRSGDGTVAFRCNSV